MGWKPIDDLITPLDSTRIKEDVGIHGERKNAQKYYKAILFNNIGTCIQVKIDDTLTHKLWYITLMLPYMYIRKFLCQKTYANETKIYLCI